jgi:hypothetical protein
MQNAASGDKKSAECIKKLAESIILQCIEDLWDKTTMKQSAEFFSRRGFSVCASIAGMDICDQVKLLDLVNRADLYPQAYRHFYADCQ